MKQFTPQSLVAALVATLAAGLFAGGCGNDDFGQDEIAQVSLKEPDGTSLKLVLPNAPQKQGGLERIELQSNGDKPLKVETAELVKAPDRLLHQGTDPHSKCTYDASNPPKNGNCEDGRYCDDELTSTDGFSGVHTCRTATVPETPITKAKGETAEFAFFLAADSQSQDLDCPDPGDDVPEELTENYCGEFRVETNATTNNDIFKDGNATFYFLQDTSESGRIMVAPKNLNFDGLEPGASANATFSIKNSGEGELTINELNVERQPGIIELTPGGPPIEIEAGGSVDFRVDVSLPSDFDMSTLQATDFIHIGSSAKNTSETGEKVTLNLKAGAGFGPALQFSKPAFSFKGGSTDTVTVENVGKKTLELDSASFRPAGLADAYTITFNGEETGTNLGSADGISSGESAKLKVEYTGDGGDVGRLIIDHNDEALFGQSSLMLLANKNGAVGDVVPDNANFQFGTESDRPVVLRNRGSDTLTVGRKWANGSTPTEISIDGLAKGDTLAPGQIASGTVRFLGNDGDQRKQPAIDFAPDAIEGPNDKQNGQLNINIATSDHPDRSATITSEADVDAENYDGAAPVGDVVRFDVEGDIQKGNKLIWMLLERPAGSKFFSIHKGKKGEEEGREAHFFVRPDKAGMYKIGVLVRGGGLEIEPTYKLKAMSN